MTTPAKDATKDKTKEAGLPAAGSGALAVPGVKKAATPSPGAALVDSVAKKVQQFINNGELELPKNYSVNNALKSAYLDLQKTKDKDGKPALEVCTHASIANALLDLIIQGLSPMKKQCYFLVYGKQLTCQRSYFGSMAIARMVNPDVGEFTHAVVYKDDTFSYKMVNGRKTEIQHEQKLENIKKNEIVAAYCIIFDKSGNVIKSEVMTFDEIKQSWRKSKVNPIDDKGNVRPDSTHGQFPADMSLRTVINKICKIIINASSDNQLLLDRINRNEELVDAAAVQEEIEEHANTGEALSIEAPEQEQADETPQSESGIESTIETLDCPEGSKVTKEQCMECAKLAECPSHQPKEEKTAGKEDTGEKKTEKTRKPLF